MTFELRGCKYRICFSYDRSFTGEPDTVYCHMEYYHMERWCPTMKSWEQLNWAISGQAQVARSNVFDIARRRQRTIERFAGLPPALRKQLVREANQHFANVPFNKEQGRKLALARYLKNLQWNKEERTAVWQAYLNRPRSAGIPKVLQTQHERQPREVYAAAQREAYAQQQETVTQPLREQELWDTYQTAIETMHRETPEGFEFDPRYDGVI